MTRPNGDSRPAAIAPQDRKAQRRETDDFADSRRPADVAARGRLKASADGDLEAAERKSDGRADAQRASARVYGALDLGTNNCRLLVARPSRRGFLVIDGRPNSSALQTGSDFEIVEKGGVLRSRRSVRHRPFDPVSTCQTIFNQQFCEVLAV